MESRRSIRDYTDQDVTDEQVEAMLKAAMAAPSAQDLRPWHFVVVRKRKRLDKLANAHKYAYVLEKAPMASWSVATRRYQSGTGWAIAGAATQNLLLAATAVGLGGAWIGLYPNKKRQKNVRELLDIPDAHGRPVCGGSGISCEKEKSSYSI